MQKYLEDIKKFVNGLEVADRIVIDTTDLINDKSGIDSTKIKKVMIENLEQEIEKAVLDKEEYLVVCAENPLKSDMVFEAFSGQWRLPLNIKGYTRAGMKELMKQHSYILVKEKLLEQENVKENNEDVFLSSGNMVYQYLAWLQEYVGANLNIKYYIQVYQRSKIKKEETESLKRPFLSIITRTQGKRIESLREALLSLAGQECMDFEVLIMGHNLDKESKRKVCSVIEETPDYLREKIRYIPVTGGNRSTPLNKGFEEAKGIYAVILDDDDIVFDHWVKSFKDKAEECPGSILHAYVIAQNWQSIKNENGEESLRACGPPQNNFCVDFHSIKQLYGNSCPVLGLAFPLNPFREMGIRFDETLDTTEDWDFLMKMSSICGVVDIKEPTSMYRIWENAENSHSIHAQEEWDNNRKKILNRFRKKPILLLSEYFDELIDIVGKHPALFGDQGKVLAQGTPLYYNNGKGYNEECSIIVGSSANMPFFRYEYMGLEKVGPISSVRWDPYDSGDIYVENVIVKIYTQDNKEIVKNMRQFHTNGFKIWRRIVFFHPDPQIEVCLWKKIRVSKIVITGRLGVDITQEMHERLTMKYDTNLVSKTKKVVKYYGKKLLKRSKGKDVC